MNALDELPEGDKIKNILELIKSLPLEERIIVFGEIKKIETSQQKNEKTHLTPEKESIVKEKSDTIEQVFNMIDSPFFPREMLKKYPLETYEKMKALINKMLDGEKKLGRIGPDGWSVEESEVGILLSIVVMEEFIIGKMDSMAGEDEWTLNRVSSYFYDLTIGTGCFYDKETPISSFIMKKLFGCYIACCEHMAALGGFGPGSEKILNHLCGGTCGFLPSYKSTIFVKWDTMSTSDQFPSQFTSEDKKILNEKLIPEAIVYALAHSPYAK